MKNCDRWSRVRVAGRTLHRAFSANSGLFAPETVSDRLNALSPPVSNLGLLAFIATAADATRIAVAGFVGLPFLPRKLRGARRYPTPVAYLHRCMSLQLNAYHRDALTPSQYAALLLPMSALCRKSCGRNASPRTHVSHCLV
jgi:hypothetical protein